MRMKHLFQVTSHNQSLCRNRSNLWKWSFLLGPGTVHRQRRPLPLQYLPQRHRLPLPPNRHRQRHHNRLQTRYRVVLLNQLLTHPPPNRLRSLLIREQPPRQRAARRLARLLPPRQRVVPQTESNHERTANVRLLRSHWSSRGTNRHSRFEIVFSSFIPHRSLEKKTRGALTKEVDEGRFHDSIE